MHVTDLRNNKRWHLNVPIFQNRNHNTEQLNNGFFQNKIQKPDEAKAYDSFVGKSVTDVKTLGKELFVFVEGEFCLRVHFLMNGSLRWVLTGLCVHSDGTDQMGISNSLGLSDHLAWAAGNWCIIVLLSHDWIYLPFYVCTYSQIFCCRKHLPLL